jgi:hypothetical protein
MLLACETAVFSESRRQEITCFPEFNFNITLDFQVTSLHKFFQPNWPPVPHSSYLGMCMRSQRIPTSSTRGVLVVRHTRQVSGAACWCVTRDDGPAPRRGAAEWWRRLLVRE